MEAVVVDDDSSMCTLLTHKANNPKERLTEEMPQLEWLVDSSHQIKVVAKYIFLLSTLPTGSSTCTKVNTIRFKNTLATRSKKLGAKRFHKSYSHTKQ